MCRSAVLALDKRTSIITIAQIHRNVTDGVCIRCCVSIAHGCNCPVAWYCWSRLIRVGGT